MTKAGEIIVDAAFLIHSIRYGDNHRILSFLTAHHGRIDLIAYGAGSSKPRFAGTLDFLNPLKLQFQNARGDLARLLQCELLDSPLEKSCFQIKRDYTRTMLVLTWFKLMAKIIPRDGGQDLNLFPLLEQALQVMAEQSAYYTHIIFLKKLLSRLGYRLDFSQCQSCHSVENSPFYFQVECGSFYCSQCLVDEASYRLSHCIPHEVYLDLKENAILLQELELLLLQAYRHFLGVEFECFERLMA